MKDHWKITGIIVGGVKKGAFFTRLEWVQEQCWKKLGFKPYPGTLNLKVSSVDIQILEELRQKQGIELIPPDSDFCSGYVFPVSVAGISGAIVSPAEDVRVHRKNIIEIISHFRLKDALNLDDGDWVTLTFERLLSV